MKVTLHLVSSVSIVMVVTTVGCRNKEADPVAAPVKTAEPVAAPAKSPEPVVVPENTRDDVNATAPAKTKDGVIVIADLGLALDGPSDGQVLDVKAGSSKMVQGTGLVVNVMPAKDTSPKTMDEAIKSEQSTKPIVLKKESLPDGYALQLKYTDAEGGTTWFVDVRRTIGGKPYLCETPTSTQETADAAYKACLSLRAK